MIDSDGEQRCRCRILNADAEGRRSHRDITAGISVAGLYPEISPELVLF
jgi:hypothetical protein